MSEPAEGSDHHPTPGSTGGGESQDRKPSKSENSGRLPAYRFDPLTQSRPSTPAEHPRPAESESTTSKSDVPPVTTTRTASTTPGLDILAEAAAIVSEPEPPDPDPGPEFRTPERPTKTPNKGKQPATPGVDPGSVTSVWSGLYRTPRDDDSILIGVHETPGPITKALSRTNTPALLDVEGHVGKQRSSSLPPQLLPSRRGPSRLHPFAAPANEAQSGKHTQTSGLAAGRLLAFLNPGIVADISSTTAATSSSNAGAGVVSNTTAALGPSQNSAHALELAAATSKTAIPRPPGSSFQAAARRPSTPTRPTTPLAPTPSPLTPQTVSTVIITPKALPNANTLDANDPNGTLARRTQTYQSFKADDEFLENNIHPIDEALIAPPIHDTYVIKTVSTIKCDECSTKLTSGGELYQCRTCSAQICQDCVNERLTQEADTKAFGIKVRQDKAFAVGGYWLAVEPEPERKVGSEGDKFEWQGGRKHLPFKRCYLDRRQFVGEDTGPFETDCVVPDHEGVLRRIGVRIVRDTPRKGGGGGHGGAVNPGKGKPKGGKGRKTPEKVEDGDDVVDGDAVRQRKRKANLKAKAKAKGKGKEPQGTEDEPIDLDEWDEDSAQAQVQSAVFGGRPAFDKLRGMQEAARLGRTMPPQSRREGRTIPPAPGRGETDTSAPQPTGYTGQWQEDVSGTAPQYSPGLYTGFGSANADKDPCRQAELDRRYLARQVQQQQWQQRYGRPFDQPQQNEDLGSTIRGHPNPGGSGNAALQGQFTGCLGFPQQQRHAPPATPYGGHLPHAGYPTPSAGLTQPSFMQHNPLYHPNLNMPAQDVASHYQTPTSKSREAQYHVPGNEATTQSPAPGWIAYIPLPSIFPDPNIHPGVYLGEPRDIPFGRGNTFIEQDPFIDGTPLSLELPQPYFDNALAGLAEIQHHNNMIGMTLRRDKRRQQREEAGIDPDAPMTEAEAREEEAEVARVEAEFQAQRHARGLRLRWYDYQQAQRSRRPGDGAQMNHVDAAAPQGQQARLPGEVRQQRRQVSTSQPGDFWEQVAKHKPQAGNSHRQADSPQAGIVSQPGNNTGAGVSVRPSNHPPSINRTTTEHRARGQPVNNLQAQVRGQQIDGSRYHIVPPPANQARQGRPTQEPVTISLIDSDEDEDTDTYVPRNVVRRARKRPRTSPAIATSAQPSRRIKFASAQAQQLFNSNTTINTTPAQQSPVSMGPQRSRPTMEPRNVVRRALGHTQKVAASPAQWSPASSGFQPSYPRTEPRNVVRRARGHTQNVAATPIQVQQHFNSTVNTSRSPAQDPSMYTGSQHSHPPREPRNVVRRARATTQSLATPPAQAQPIQQFATVFGHTPVWPPVYRGPMPSHPSTEPRNVVRRARPQFEAPGMRYQGALRYITGQVDAVDSTDGLPTRFVFVGVDYPFTASPTVGQPSLLPPVHFGPHASRIEMADDELSTRNRDTMVFNGFDSPVPPSSSPVREDGERLNVLVAAAKVVGDEDETESEGGAEGGEDVEMGEASEDVAPVKRSRLRSGKEFQ